MATTQFTTEPPLCPWYGCSFQECNSIVSLVPTQVVGFVPVREEFAGCGYEDCIKLDVFANGSGVDKENDQSYFLFDFPTASGNNYALQKWVGGAWATQALISAATGEVYDFGTWVGYPKRSGVKIEWAKVLALYGAGIYRLSITGSINPTTITSPAYCLAEFECYTARSYTRLDTEFEGDTFNIVFDEDVSTPMRFDLNTMRWNDQIRLKGIVTEGQTETTDTVYIKASQRGLMHKSERRRVYNWGVVSAANEILKRIEAYGFTASKMNLFGYIAVATAGTDVIGDNAAFSFDMDRTGKVPIATASLKSRYNADYERCNQNG